MYLLSKILGAAVVTAALLPAQPIPVYHSDEESCEANPHSITCKDGKPRDFQAETDAEELWLWNSDEQTRPTVPAPHMAAPARSPRSDEVQYPLTPPSPTGRAGDLPTFGSGIWLGG